jgi:flagellar biosynthetic protein FliQ
MDPSALNRLAHDALVLALLLSLPVLAAALAGGVLTGLLQSYTRLSDPAIQQVVRVAAVFLVALAVAPWVAGGLADFARTAWTMIQDVGAP